MWNGQHLLLEFFEFVIFLLSVVFYLFLRFVFGVFNTFRSVWSRVQVGWGSETGEIVGIHSLAVKYQ